MGLGRDNFRAKLAKRSAAQEQAAERRRMDPFLRALKAIHSVSIPDPMDSSELDRQRKTQEILGRLAAPMNGMQWEPCSIGSMDAAWVRVDRIHRRRHAILYCHGGGYTSGNLGYSRVLASKLAAATGYEVLTFEYRLAPEHPYPAAIDDAQQAWDYLMHQGYGARDVVLAGDSAGGNLALVLSLRLRDAGRMLPAALLLLSPWTDMTMSGPSYRERADIDPMLTEAYIRAVREAYAPDADYASPYLSPLFADLTGLPPALIQVGSHEILYSDAARLHEQLEAAGIYSRLEVFEDMWHVFQMFPLKKASQAITNMSHFLLELP